MTVVYDEATGDFIDDSEVVAGQQVTEPIIAVPTTNKDAVNLAKDKMQEQVTAGKLKEEQLPKTDVEYMRVAQTMLSPSGVNSLKKFSRFEQLALDEIAPKYRIPLGCREDLLGVKSNKVIDIILDDSGSTDDDSGLEYDKLMKVEKSLLRPEHKYGINKFDEQIMETKKILDVVLCLDMPGTLIAIRTINNPTGEDVIAYTLPKFDSVQQKNEYKQRIFNKLDKLTFETAAPTPVMAALRSIPTNAKTLSIMFSDGFPDDGGRNISVNVRKPNGRVETIPCPKKVYDFYTRERDPEQMPAALIKIGNDEADEDDDNQDSPEWMEAVDLNAKNVDCIDDYISEKRQVQRINGKDFPFTQGLRIIKILRPDMTDYDKLDERVISKDGLQKIVGIKFSQAKYDQFVDTATRGNRLGRKNSLTRNNSGSIHRSHSRNDSYGDDRGFSSGVTKPRSYRSHGSGSNSRRI
jgi:hypothetical protein